MPMEATAFRFLTGGESCINPTQRLNLCLRFRKVPTFGRGTIRRFGKNVSAMKKLAGRDFEDILQVTQSLLSSLVPIAQLPPRPQCIIPVVEGLLPQKHNDVVGDLLFELATWHGFAKLRIHTDKTLDRLTDATKALTRAMRIFLRETCREFHTVELPKEAEARGRRTAALSAKANGHTVKGKATVYRKPKKLNLATYKYHALADYAETIRRFGPTDNYNTQIVCLVVLSLTQYHRSFHILGRVAAPPGQEILCEDKSEQCHTPDRKSPETRIARPVHRVQEHV